MADAKGKQLEVFVSKTEAELLGGEPNVLGLSSDRNTIVFNGKVVGSGANIHYKQIQIASGGAGWYRFAVNHGGFAQQPSAIFCIERRYSQRKDEHYLFASTKNHNGYGNITQLAGYHNAGNGHFITKIRFAQKTSSADGCFLDFYTTAETTEVYFVWIIGNWNALDIYKVDDEEEDQTYAYQVIETSLGFMPSEYTEFRSKLFGDLSVGDGTPTDAMYVVTNGTSGYETNWYRRPFSLVWSYIKSKIASVLGLTETSLKIGSHTEFKSGGAVEMQGGSTYGNYNKALGYHSCGGLASGVEGKPYARFEALSTRAMTVDGNQTYFAEALPSASLTYTYDGTEHSYTNSSTYTQWIVIINHADFLGSGVFPFNKCYFFGGRVLPDVDIASATELTEGSGTWQVVLQSRATTTDTSIDRTTSATLRALIASTNETAHSTAAARQSFVGGYYSNAYGYRAGTGAVNYANAFGNQSYCGSNGAMAFGMFSLALGQNAIALGQRSVASGSNSVTLGYEAMAAAAYSNALGVFTKTGRQYQTAVGYYNEGKSDTLFEVGYGSSTARKNVFEVTTDGTVKATKFIGNLEGAATKATQDAEGNTIADTYYSNVTAVGNQLTFTKPSGATKTVTIDVEGSDSTTSSATIATPEFDDILTDEITETMSGVLTWDKIYYSTALNKFVARSGSVGNYTYHGTYSNNDNSYLQYGTGVSGGTLTNKTFRKSGTDELYVYNNNALEHIRAGALTYGSSLYRTESIIWSTTNFACASNSKITKYPTNIASAMLFLQLSRSVISTAIPFNGILLTRYPIKLCTDTANGVWADAYITIQRAADSTYGFLPTITIYDSSGNDITSTYSAVTLRGYLTGTFTES